MSWTRLARRVSSWIAIAAIAMISIAPAVSQALAHAGRAAAAEDCEQHALAGHHAPSPDDAGAPAEACGYCSMHFVALGLAMPPSLPHGEPLPGTDVLALFLQAPRATFAWAAPPSRAPPLA